VSEADVQREEVERQRWEILQQLEDWLEIPMVVLGFVWLVLLVVELTRGLHPFLEAAGTVIWILFVLDFLLRFTLAPRKLAYLKHNVLILVALVLPARRGRGARRSRSPGACGPARRRGTRSCAPGGPGRRPRTSPRSARTPRWGGEALEKKLEAHVKQVRLSGRLTRSPVVLVGAEHDYSPHLERLLATGVGSEALPKQRRILELNPRHEIVQKLRERFAAHPEDPALGDYAELLFGWGLIAEGSPLHDPVRYNQLVVDLMGRSL
jgi:hypothetical protein